MIVFDLECRTAGHRFEGWFGSSDDFALQHADGLVDCPQCGSADVVRALSAPRVGRKGNQLAPVAPAAERAAPPAVRAAEAREIPPKVLAAMHALATFQAEAIKHSRWVGDGFVEDVRAMHYGERDHELVHGQASREEAEALVDEGIMIAPLLIPVAPPDELN